MRPTCSPQGSRATSTISLIEIAGGRRFTSSASSTSGARKASRIIRPTYWSEIFLDLSRFCAAPLITYCEAKETSHEHRQDG